MTLALYFASLHPSTTVPSREAWSDLDISCVVTQRGPDVDASLRNTVTYPSPLAACSTCPTPRDRPATHSPEDP